MKFRCLILFLILFPFGSSQVYADTDPRLVQLEVAINQLENEQQSLYQQFLMTQELRMNTFQEMDPMRAGSINYDEIVRLQRSRVEQLERYDRDLSQAYSRFLEIGDQKKVLLDQLIELTQPTNP